MAAGSPGRGGTPTHGNAGPSLHGLPRQGPGRTKTLGRAEKEAGEAAQRHAPEHDAIIPEARRQGTGGTGERAPRLQGESPGEPDGVPSGSSSGRTVQAAAAGDAPAGPLVRPPRQRGGREGVGNHGPAKTAVRRSRAGDAEKDRAAHQGGPIRRQPAGDRAEDQEDSQGTGGTNRGTHE